MIPGAMADPLGVNAREPIEGDPSIATAIKAVRSSPRAVSRYASRSAPADLVIPLVGLAAVCGLAAGWTHRHQMDLVAHEGLGYALGVAGLAMMSLLLLYSARKRWRPLRRAGPAPLWLQIHMALGLLGPTAIAFHANFQAGSLNSRVALVCMAVVSSSGVIGRFLYTRIHAASADQKKVALDYRATPFAALAAATRICPELDALLARLRKRVLEAAPASRCARARAFVRIGVDARLARRHGLNVYRRALAARPTAAAAPVPEVGRCLRRYAADARALARLDAYEHAFALWHALHLPFCVVLFGAAAVHVVAVHMY